MFVFEWLTVQPVAFFNVIVHTNLAFVCIALTLFVSIITCAREGRKKDVQRTTNESHPSQPISNTDTASKKATATATTSSTTPNGTKKAAPLPPQPASGPSNKDANCDEEKGVRKKHKREESEKKDENRGSIRISIYGAAASSSEHDDEIFMQDVFDDVTAKDDLFPGESADNKKKKGRKKKTASSCVSRVQSTQYDTDRVEPTQASSDQPTSTVDPTIEGTKDPTHTVDQTRETTIDQTRDPSKADATTSERQGARIHPKRASGPRRSASRNKGSVGGNQRKKKSAFKYDASKTGESGTESTKKRIPKNRKKVSACTKVRTRSSDAPSFTPKD